MPRSKPNLGKEILTLFGFYGVEWWLVINQEIPPLPEKDQYLFHSKN
jgi:hypothetical protein